MADWYYGQKVANTTTFKDAAGTPVDPDAVFFQFKDPSGVPVEYEYSQDEELVKDSVGVYHVYLDLDVTGWWYWRWYSTGNYQTASEGRFRVAESEFD